MVVAPEGGIYSPQGRQKRILIVSWEVLLANIILQERRDISRSDLQLSADKLRPAGKTGIMSKAPSEIPEGAWYGMFCGARPRCIPSMTASHSYDVGRSLAAGRERIGATEIRSCTTGARTKHALW